MRIATGWRAQAFRGFEIGLRRFAKYARERGLIMQVRPARGASIAVLYCDPINGDRAKTLFESVLRQKLERFRWSSRAERALAVLENGRARIAWYSAIAAARKPRLCWWLRPPRLPGQTTLWAARWKRSVTRSNASWRPLSQGISCQMAYKVDDIPIMAAPGCFRSLKPNVVDLLMPPLMARSLPGVHLGTRVPRHGGLLS